MMDGAIDLLGACVGDDDPDAWFAGPGERARREYAVRKCMSCPVRNECLELALSRQFPGIWAGTSEKERKRLQRAQRRSTVDA